MHFQRIAVPHLYRYLTLSHEDPTDALECLATLLLVTPQDHHRTDWIKSVSIEVVGAEHGSWDPLDLSDSLVVLFTRARLEHFVGGLGTFIREGTIACLLYQSKDTLSSLKIGVDSRNIRILHILPHMAQLSRLELHFSLFDKMDFLPDMAQVPPLVMPHVFHLGWRWDMDDYLIDQERRGVDKVMQYLASCQFGLACEFALEFYNTLPRHLEMLNPLFCRHHSSNVILHLHNTYEIPVTSDIFKHSQAVHLMNCKPPSQIFAAERLPEDISLRPPSDGDWEPEELYDMFEALVQSKYSHKTRIQLHACTTDDAPFRWDWAPQDPEITDEYRDMCMKLVQYARVLAPKGIRIADTNMKTLTYNLE